MPIAREIIERKIAGDLLPSIVLEWDDGDLAGCTVRDVLADPDKFVGETLADPAEGTRYGRGKGKVMRRPAGSMWINSFAHGHHAYGLKYDSAMVKVAILAGAEAEAANILVSMLPRAVVDRIELDELKQIACKRSGARPRALDSRIKEAEQKAKADARAVHEPRDGRVVLPAPTLNAERLPVVTDIDEVLCDTLQPIPPMRDRKGIPIKVVIHSPEIMHRLTTAGTNAEEKPSKRLAAPPQPVLVPHSKVSMAQLIERHVAFQVTNKDGETSPVALHPIFVEHYMEFEESKLPKARGIMTAPVVLLDGTLLAPDGYHPPTRLIFMIDPALRSYLPRPEECTQEEAAKSLQFLTDDWLCDVAATFEGKCAAIAYSITIIERTMFDKRPMWLGDAPSRGGGKTTLAVMLNLVATGRWPSAVAYSPNPEERRKAMMSVLIAGPEAVMWDNVKAGTVISCSSFERASTNPIYSDRELSKTNNLEAYAYPPQMVNGNNISGGGEVASRTIKITLDAKRPDPEKRAFKHPDPIGWTLDHRGEILRHFYILLVANQAAKPGSNEQNKTRFPDWWRAVGAALEHAAETLVEQQKERPARERTAAKIDFARIIAEAEQDNADNRDHACVLAALRDTYGTDWFTSAMVSAALKADAEQARVDADKAKADGKAKDAEPPSDRPIDIIRGYFEKNLRRGTSLSPSNITATFAPILGTRVYEGAGDRTDNYRRMHVEREEHTAANKVIRFRVVLKVGDPDKPDDVQHVDSVAAAAPPAEPPPPSSPEQEPAPRPAVNGFAGANVVMEVFYKASARFGDDTARANEWMQTEQPALGMRRPDQVCSDPDGVALCLAALAKAAV
jgi:hypothetical protein